MRQRQSEIAEMEARIDELRRKHPPEVLREGFVSGELDPLYADIGELALGDRAGYFEPHIKIWTGYEATLGNKYARI